ncbi:hypothetical protein [Aliiglaciecola sp. LCG003]|uniref:hypothetical protein n=1 Tax=Aliiglaciecola sp. LCG003 TaxID=3053655 RepID=UPI0025743667|nr:hypothetical protein [Aliiglaciecola sp. LCG003]WJG08333.1 hypothetical protein QR722_13410 [Aliiglaciecola sp. LCG003]
MKTNTYVKAAAITLLLSSTMMATSAQAGSKVKPPAADPIVETTTWYAPVLAFFAI